MKQTINFTNFVDAFRAYNRMDNFSYDGLKSIFEMLEEYEEDTAQEIELDVIGICCEFCESTPEQLRQDYLIPNDEEIVDYLDNNARWYSLLDSGNIVYQCF